jgi:ionotropic kainate glutamate receptor 2
MCHETAIRLQTQLHAGFRFCGEIQSVSQAIVDVVRDFLHWSAFTVLYETDEGLLRLQEVLKTSERWDPKITVRQFLPGSDQR